MMKRRTGDLVLYVATGAVLVALVLWIRWMVVAPYWLELFR